MFTFETLKTYWPILVGLIGAIIAWVKYEWGQTSNITRSIDAIKWLREKCSAFEAEFRQMQESWELATDTITDEGEQLRKIVAEQDAMIIKCQKDHAYHVLKFNALAIVIESHLERDGLTINIFEEVDGHLAEAAMRAQKQAILNQTL